MMALEMQADGWAFVKSVSSIELDRSSDCEFGLTAAES